MSEKMMKKSRVVMFALLGVLAVAALSIWGCGHTSYDTPAEKVVTTKTLNALITADDLNGWIKAGLVNKPGGFDRVVILDVSNDESDGTNKYKTVGHIPGAQLISAGSNAFQDNTRAEGPFKVTGAMVCTGAVMDALIQNAGIDENTTVVITNNANNIVNVSRAYATFRYWGFPKNRIKVLQGGNAGWTEAGYALTDVIPTITKSTYGVAQNGTTNVNTDMRVSLPEMINYVKGIVDGNAGKVTLVDTVRGAASPVTPDSLKAKVSKTQDLLDAKFYTPFDGAIKGSYNYPAPYMVVSGLKFKDTDTIKTDLAAAYGTDGATQLGAANRDATKTFISFCRAGNYASVGYFLLDGIVYYDDPTVDVKWYDGSYGQWNLLVTSDRKANDGTTLVGGQLKVGSIWDTTSLMENLTWNVERSLPIIDYSGRVYKDTKLGVVEPSFENGNQIEDADKAYRSSVTRATSGGASSGGGGC